jgi:signal transduction histidine kinase
MDQTNLIGSKRLEHLVEISRHLSSTLDLPTLLQEIVEAACELTESESSSILLFDKESNQLRFEAAPGVLHDDLKNIPVPLESSAAGIVYTSKKPLLIHEAASDPRIFRAVDEALNSTTHSLLGVPMVINQKSIGVIETVNKIDNGHYTEDDQVILESLAAQAAIAIDNARLLGELQEANIELTRLDRMKSDFIAIASHELRTPLGLILGHATFLKDQIEDEFAEQMDVIIRSAMRLKTIVEDMATIAHKEEGASRVRHEPFSMGRLVENTVLEFQAEATEKAIDIDFDVPDDDPLFVPGEREKIEVVLSNLIKNAITFTDEGGQVGVKAEGDGKQVMVFVVDTGIGIPEDAIEQVFDRFFQVESHLTRTHGGMGLGLSIAKAMVDMHSGQIWCESKEGVGSLFCFTLPISDKVNELDPESKVFRSY